MAKNDEPKAPENAADVVKNAQKEIGSVGDLADAPVTPELQDASARLVAAAADARTRAAAEYPFMVYDATDQKRPPRTVHTVEEYNAAVDDGFGDDPGVTRHGTGDGSEEREIQRRAELRVREDQEKEAAQARLDAEAKAAESGTRSAKGGRK